MAGLRLGRAFLEGEYATLSTISQKHGSATSYRCVFCQQRTSALRQFSSSTVRRRANNNSEREPFSSRLRTALRDTKIRWYPIPIGLGIGFLGFTQLYRQQQQREEKRRDEVDDIYHNSGGEHQDGEGRPKKRKRIRPSGPWYDIHNVQFYTRGCIAEP